MEQQDFSPAQPVKLPSKTEKFIFHGEGKALFSIVLLNVVFSIITLGLYYPWAKASYLKYTYGETEFKGGRFTFHGTGKEMFIGMIKAVLVLLLLFTVSYISAINQKPWIAPLVYIPAMIFLFPLAIVGSLRYRLSRSSWRGIHFAYIGTYKKMLKLQIKGILLMIVSLGIYHSWYISDLYKEILSNVRFGNIRFEYSGKGGDYFGKFIGGYHATLFTLGIYAFKWQSEMHNYIINNVKVKFEGEEKVKGKFVAQTTGSGYFFLLVGNLLITVFTLGLGFPWTIVRTLKYYAETTDFKNRINFDVVSQTEVSFADASGEGFADALDFQLI